MILEQIALVAVGFIAMFFATFSGGGALVQVPALLFLGLPPASAVATNRLAIFVQTLGRFPDLRGKLEVGRLIPIAVAGAHTIGAIIGALILVSIDQFILFKLIGAMIILAAILMYFSEIGIEKAVRKNISNKSIALASFIHLFLGFFRGLFGPGVGIIGRIVAIRIIG
ncbi:MAG: sulfite exporter TauE/SafE family protein, partial [archaeon]|nr:sulfite exporter TauE/SafE family protein [archaeon]